MAATHTALLDREALMRPRETGTIDAAIALAPAPAEFVISAIALMIALIGHFYGDSVVETTNLIVPSLLILGLSYGCLRMARLDIACIWAPLFWNRVVLIAYFGVGSIVTQFVNEDTLRMIEAFFLFFPSDVGKYNLVNCVFVFVFYISIFVTGKFLSQNAGARSFFGKFEPSNLSVRNIALVLIAVGGLAYYTVILPTSFGIANFEFPAFLTQLSNGVYVGIFLLTFWSLRSGSKFFYFAVFMTVLHFSLGVVQFNKSEAVLPLVMFGVGYIYARPSLFRMMAAFVAVFALYSAIASVVSYGRLYISTFSVDARGSSVAVRLDALRSYAAGADQATESSIQTGWARLSYVNGATFAINEYDSGKPGNSLDNALIVWIPRLIYPDKPIITQGGIDFNLAATNSDTSAATPGIPAEGYWNAGWIGVVSFGVVIAVVFTFWSFYTFALLRSGAWHLFFIVLFGMRSGSRIDGMFVPDVLGPIAYAIVGHIALQFLNRLIAGRGQRPTNPVFV